MFLNARNDVRTIALARTVRWIGWGFGEPLLPVFIALFAATFAEAGLIRSVYDLVTLLALPVVGKLADKYPARTLILVALILYPLIGIGYFLAGVTGFALFIVATRLLNGAVWAVESVGVDTYYRRMTPANEIGSAFGYIDMLANLGWMLAALASIWLSVFIPIHWLLLAITPFALAAFFIARKVSPDTIAIPVPQPLTRLPLQKLFSRFKKWGARMYLLGTLVFLTDILSTLSSFFVPIYIYQETGSATEAIVIAIISAVPSLFGFQLGKLVDTAGEKKVLAIGLAMVVMSLLTAYYYDEWLVLLLIVFVIEVALELFTLAQKSYVTKFSPPALWGEQGSTMHAIGVLGGIIGPVIIGISFDVLSVEFTFLVLAGLSSLLLALVLVLFSSSAREKSL